MNKQEEEAATQAAGSSAEGTASQTLDPWFLSLLACPGCTEHHAVTLDTAQNTLNCACGRYAFPIRDGIPILLVEEATVLNADADPAHLALK